MGAPAKEPARLRERLRGWEGDEGRDAEQAEGQNATCTEEGGGYAEGLEDSCHIPAGFSE